MIPKGAGHLCAVRPSRRWPEDMAAIHLWIELEIEGVQALVSVAELGLLVTTIQQPLAATGKFVRDQDGDQVDRCHGLGLRLQQTGFHHCGHAAQAQLHQGTIEFYQVWIPRSGCVVGSGRDTR
jgi:hypothetical protein